MLPAVKFRALGILLTGLLLVPVAGCGSSDDASSPDAPGAAPAARLPGEPNLSWEGLGRAINR